MKKSNARRRIKNGERKTKETKTNPEKKLFKRPNGLFLCRKAGNISCQYLTWLHQSIKNLPFVSKRQRFNNYVVNLGTGALDSTFSIASASSRFRWSDIPI